MVFEVEEERGLSNNMDCTTHRLSETLTSAPSLHTINSVDSVITHSLKHKDQNNQ